MSVKNLCLVIYLNTDFIRVNVVNVQVSIYNGYCFPSYPDSLPSPLLSSSIQRVTQNPGDFNNGLFNKHRLWHFSIHTWITKKTLSKFHSHSHWHCCQGSVPLAPNSRPYLLLLVWPQTEPAHITVLYLLPTTHSFSLSLPSMVFLAKLLTLCYQDLIAQMLNISLHLFWNLFWSFDEVVKPLKK